VKNVSSRQSNFVDKSIVTIKPEAYYKMLVHVLRFGNRARNTRQYKEVMGMLIGRLEGEGDPKNVIIEDVVPISHGGQIEVAFKPDDYVSFSYADAEYAERDPPLFTVGWYHSHPALKIFFSSTDIKNQLGWQTPNPSAIGIVFDHTYLENPGDMGFRTFRLDDPSKGPLTDYHEVKTIVEPPDDIEYYVKIIHLIDSIHSKEPPILEINETPDLFGDIMVPGQSQMMAKQPEFAVTDLVGALQTGISNLLEFMFEPLIRFLNNWSQELIKKVVENNLQMRADLAALKDSISMGINEIQTSVKSLVTNQIYDLDAYIDDRLEAFDNDQEKIKASIESLKEETIEKINKIFEEKVIPSINQQLELLDKIPEKIELIEEKTNTGMENVNSQKETLANLSEKIHNIQNSYSESVKSSQDKISSIISGKLSNISGNITDLNKDAKEFSTNLDAALSILESSKQSLSQKLKKPEQGGGEA